MPILVNNETYNGLGSLYANAGDWVSCTFNFSTRYYVNSSEQDKYTYVTTGTQHYITSTVVDFGDSGFLAGDAITLRFYSIPLGAYLTFNKTVTFVNGNVLFFDSALSIAPNTVVFPEDGQTYGISIQSFKNPASIETYINLTPNGTVSPNSVLDGSVNRFEVQDISSLTVGNSLPLVQLGDFSGGLIKDVELTYVANANEGWRDWSISYKVWDWGVLQDGYQEPNYYLNTDCLAPYVNMIAFSQYGNPNGIMEASSSNVEGNTGGFDENYNGGVNNYTFQSIEWFDSLSNPIDALDNSGECTFEAKIVAPNQDAVNSRYNIGFVFRPIDDDIYSNLPTNAGQNLILNAPEVDFVNSLTPDTTIYSSYQNSDGAGFDLTDLQFTNSAGILTVKGKVIPNAAYTTYFSNLADDERRITIWVGLSNHNFTGSFSDRVNLKIFDADNYDAPTLGVQIPDVVNEYLYDHGGIDITGNALPQTTTEDDVLYKSDFLLIEGLEYEGIRTRIYAYNTVNEDEFTLEDNFFSFSNVPFVNNQYNTNQTVNRNFNLPPSTDRNVLELVRKANLDVAGKYGYQLRYGFLNDWRYWMPDNNVNNDFYDPTQPNDGKNKNWQVFSAATDWELRIAYYTRLNGVDDFNIYPFGIRPYEDDLNVTTVETFTVTSSGQVATSLLNNELHTYEAVLTWNQNYVNPWAEVTIEDYESGNRWVISSVLDQGNISSNPLKPIAGQTKLDLQIASNVATLTCLIDTNQVDVSKVCISARIFSEEVLDGKRMTDNTIKETTDGTIKNEA